MKVALSRNALMVAAGGPAARVVPLLAPVNDLIGLRGDHEYSVHVESTYWPLWPSSWPEDLPDDLMTYSVDGQPLEPHLHLAVAHLERVGKEIESWRRRRFPKLFLQAALPATEGRFSSRLGPLYERVVRKPPDADDVPDGELPVLAAWVLDQALGLWPLELRECPLCKVPWLASPEQTSPYCLRPYPGRHMSCRDLKKDEHFRESQRDWRLEYKRINERKRRGTLSEADWNAWRAENHPHAWIAFDTWKERQIPSTVGTGRER